MIFEKVNPAHPDKIADRIAGALVDLAYRKNSNPKIAVEVLIGHGDTNIIIESSEHFTYDEVKRIVTRIAGKQTLLNIKQVPQDQNLASNQDKDIKCGDNGIFKGVPTDPDEQLLADIAHKLYDTFGSDGKYIIDDKDLIICQSNATNDQIKTLLPNKYNATINPLGYWTGGCNVDSGATNRKIGSDLGRAATGGGLHGKDLSKADVTLNIYAHILAEQIKQPVEFKCAIGDDAILGKKYSDIVKIAKEYIDNIGGFEKFAEYGIIR